MYLVPAPAVRLMKRRVLSRPGINRIQLMNLAGLGLHEILVFFSPPRFTFFLKSWNCSAHMVEFSLASSHVGDKIETERIWELA